MSGDYFSDEEIAKRAPTLEDVLLACRQGSLPEKYGHEWFDEMRRNNWCYVSGGKTIEVKRRNFKYVLNSFWRFRNGDLKNGKDNFRGNQPDRSTHYEEGLGAKIGRQYGI